MAKFNVIVEHVVQREVAVTRLQGFSDRMREEAPVEVSEVEEVWDESGNLSFSFKALGFKISGSMITTHTEITIDGKLPFAALPFRGAIESQIADKVREAIG